MSRHRSLASSGGPSTSSPTTAAPIAATNTTEMMSSSSAADALAMDFREQITNAIQEAIAKNITKAAEFY